MSDNAKIYAVASTFASLVVSAFVGFALITSAETCTTVGGIELCEVNHLYALMSAVITFFFLSVINAIIALLVSINDRVGGKE